MTSHTTPDTPETHSFQAEIRQLLHIVINSLYTHRDIFARELISNAADALEKFRHEALVNPDLPEKDRTLEIHLEVSEDAKTFTIRDNGIGMTHKELVLNLGTIAQSGTRAFLERLAGSARPDVQLIGQFGVGFYSAFMVARKVTVETRSFHPDAPGWRWESTGEGTYTITPAEGAARGTSVTIELREDAEEYAKDWKIRETVRQFSNFVPFPILLNGEKINTVQAIWTRNRSELKEEDYREFYQFISHTGEEPLFTLHFAADAPLAINALLYVPKDNIERLGFGRMKPGVDLYCRKVMIRKQPEELLPDWMRFVRGVIDSEDLPLNISRETLQDSRLVQKLSRVIAGRFLKFLDEQARKDPEKYKQFHRTHGTFLKEGLAQDFQHREELAGLLRFESSRTAPGEAISLSDYIERMVPGQEAIYYINGPSRAAIEAGPYVEAFAQRGIEVLYTFEPLDDFVMSQLGEYKEKRLVSADTHDLSLPGEAPAAEGEELPQSDADELCGWLKTTLGERVHQVKSSSRLVKSPAAATMEGGMSSAMQRLMQAMSRETGTAPSYVTLEINRRSPLVHRLNALRRDNEEFATELAEQLLDNALLAAGLLADPRGMVERMNRLLAKAAGA